MTPCQVLDQIRGHDPKPRVAVLGDRIEDHWWFVSSSRTSRESGGELPIYEWDKDVSPQIICPGGAASASASLSVLLTPLPAHRHPRSYAYRSANIDTGRIFFRMDWTRIATPWVISSLWGLPPSETDCALLSDYGRGFFSLGNLPEITKLFSKVVFSPDHFTCMRMTQDEIESLKDCVWLVNDEEMQILVQRGLFPYLSVVTHGSEGVDLNCLHEEFCLPRVMALPVDLVAAPHYCGVGDVFAASLSAAYFCDVPLEDAIPFAIACCRVVLQASRRGTLRLLPEDLDKL